MNFGIYLLFALVSALPVAASTLYAPAVPDNSSTSYTTPDALLTVRAYADSNATVSANFGQADQWFGVVNGNPSAIDGAECVTLQFGQDAALYGIAHVWTRSRVIISGFKANPGFSDPNGYASSVSYASGTLSYFLPWDAGSIREFAFTNPAASAGATLRLNVFDTSPGWQATITKIDYTPGLANPVAHVGVVRQTMDNFSASDA